MAAETITVYIDPTQLADQKKNNYSLYLAKMVNGSFTVIWQSMGPIATSTNPAYEYKNTFQIAIPSYQVNYGTVTTNQGSVTFSAGGLPVDIDVGQSVTLGDNGIFGSASNTGTAGEITINNQLQDNPNAILLDSSGNTIYVDTQSGMDIGTATLTPIDQYQLWFYNEQDTGTIISQNTGVTGTVTFSGGVSDMTITYNASGAWENGPPSAGTAASEARLERDAQFSSGVGVGTLVQVLGTFKYALTAGAITYLGHQLINKFSSNLKPKSIAVDGSKKTLTVTFSDEKTKRILDVFGPDKFVQAVQQALTSAQSDANSGLKNESWVLSEPNLLVFF